MKYNKIQDKNVINLSKIVEKNRLMLQGKRDLIHPDLRRLIFMIYIVSKRALNDIEDRWQARNLNHLNQLTFKSHKGLFLSTKQFIIVLPDREERLYHYNVKYFDTLRKLHKNLYSYDFDKLLMCKEQKMKELKRRSDNLRIKINSQISEINAVRKNTGVLVEANKLIMSKFDDINYVSPIKNINEFIKTGRGEVMNEKINAINKKMLDDIKKISLQNGVSKSAIVSDQKHRRKTISSINGTNLKLLEKVMSKVVNGNGINKNDILNEEIRKMKEKADKEWDNYINLKNERDDDMIPTVIVKPYGVIPEPPLMPNFLKKIRK